jgi:hypothetical protein
MLEWAISVLDMVVGPETWRTMSGPAVASGAVMFSVLGLMLAVGGGAALVGAADNTARLVAGAVLAMGLVLLWSVVAGVRAFHRAKSEQS